MSRDPWKRSGYWAERKAFGENERFYHGTPSFATADIPFTPSIDSEGTIHSWLAEIKRSQPALFPCPIKLENRHRSIGASARFDPRTRVGYISFGPTAKRWVILHELAHILSAARGDTPGHGLGWMKAYLEIVLAVFGQADHDTLEQFAIIAGYDLL